MLGHVKAFTLLLPIKIFTSPAEAPLWFLFVEGSIIALCSQIDSSMFFCSQDGTQTPFLWGFVFWFLLMLTWFCHNTSIKFCRQLPLNLIYSNNSFLGKFLSCSIRTYIWWVLSRFYLLLYCCILFILFIVYLYIFIMYIYIYIIFIYILLYGHNSDSILARQ